MMASRFISGGHFFLPVSKNLLSRYNRFGKNKKAPYRRSELSHVLLYSAYLPSINNSLHFISVTYRFSPSLVS